MVDFTQVVLSRQANIAIYFREEKNLDAAALAEINGLRKKFDRVLSNLLHEGVAAGEFHIKDVNLAALAIGGMISWAYTWHRPEGRLALDDMCERMADLALQMVGAQQHGDSGVGIGLDGHNAFFNAAAIMSSAMVPARMILPWPTKPCSWSEKCRCITRTPSRSNRSA